MVSSELELGFRLFQEGRLAEAASACSRHLSTRPEDSHALHLLGRVYLKAGRAAEAVTVLERAATADSANPQILLSFGSACRAERDLIRAASAFERATAVSPMLAA